MSLLPQPSAPQHLRPGRGSGAKAVSHTLGGMTACHHAVMAARLNGSAARAPDALPNALGFPP